MRRRRRASQPTDSLELLLDTLCNTFGGILFIAILVVILLQMAGSRSSTRGNHPVSAEELHDLVDELEVVTREVETLRKNTLFTGSVGPLSAETADDWERRLAEARERFEEVTRLCNEKLVEVSRHDAETLAVDEELAILKTRTERAVQEADELRREVEKEKKAHARSIWTPVMHRTDKQNLCIELRYARLYVLHRYSPSGERLGPNLDDYVLISEELNELDVTADPTRGLPMAPNPALAAALSEKLARFPPSDWVLDLAVRADSFDVYHSLLEAARGLGYEMRAILVEEDQVFRDRGGTRQEVQ